jgi:hypothetical protein
MRRALAGSSQNRVLNAADSHSGVRVDLISEVQCKPAWRQSCGVGEDQQTQEVPMHFDLAHAVVSAALILLTIYVMRKTGVADATREKTFDWKIFLGVIVVMFVFNMIWPF